MTHQLTKKLQHLKKKIKQFEEQFEKERNYKVRMGLLTGSGFFLKLVVLAKKPDEDEAEWPTNWEPDFLHRPSFLLSLTLHYLILSLSLFILKSSIEILLFIRC